MLRGPVQATFPTLEHFPREVGTSGHVYPFPARSVSPVMPQAADLRLPTNMASATFWRSPYSEALRQSKSSLSSHSHRASSCGLSSRDSQRAPLQELNRERNAREEKSAGCTPERRKSILKSGSEGRGDSASDTSSENRQIRGILCKSSVSSSSRQSGSKVQKRVKFDDSVDKGENGHCCRHHAASSGSGAAPRHDHQQQHHHHRSLSASVSTRAHVRMPSLRHDGDRLQSIDKSCLHHSHAQCNGHHHQQQQHNHHHHHQHDPHQHPHIPRPSSGPMICLNRGLNRVSEVSKVSRGVGTQPCSGSSRLSDGQSSLCSEDGSARQVLLTAVELWATRMGSGQLLFQSERVLKGVFHCML